MSRLLKAALTEIILLNDAARDAKERTSREFQQRESELVQRIEILNRVLADQKDEILKLRLQLSNTPTTRPQRHVADEMGLREGMGVASGLVAEKEPDQNG